VSDDVFYTRVIVHADVPAANADEAVAKLCESVRAGIGPEGGYMGVPEGHPAHGRKWGTAIAASLATSRASGERDARANEQFMRRFADD
jgi:hypothetical protein